MNVEAAWTCCITAIAVAIIITTAISSSFWLANNKVFAEHGYVECILPGLTSTTWCKP